MINNLLSPFFILVVKWDGILGPWFASGPSVNHQLTDKSMEQWWNGSWQEDSLSIVCLLATNLTSIAAPLNPGFFGGKPATNGLSSGLAIFLSH